MTIKVYPGAKRPTHQISLSDGVQTFGLRLADGPRSVEEVPLTPSTVHFAGDGGKFGDWEPGISHIEQRTWVGGRANGSFVDDPTRYADAKMAWTLTPGKLFPVPNWKFSSGYLNETVEDLPGDLGWRGLYGDYSIISQQIAHSNNWSTYDQLYLWVRRVGNPTTLTVRLCADAAGDPGLEKASASISAADYHENELYLVAFDLSGGAALVGTASHIQVEGVSAWDSAANHWEVGVDADGGTGQYYYSGSYHAASFSLYHRLSTAVAERKWRFFEYRGAQYAVDSKASGAVSSVYINGDRGVATSGAGTYLRDTNKSWPTNQFQGAWVKIIDGTGAGQSREIGSNSAVQLNVSPDWEITPDATSEYVIYHTGIWQYLVNTGGVVKDVAVVDSTIYLAQGSGQYIRRVRFDPTVSPPAHSGAYDGTNNADFLLPTVDADNSVQVYAASAADAEVRRASPVSWGTNLTFGSALSVGESDQPVTSLAVHDGKLIAFKPDGRYLINADDSVEKTLGETGFIRSANNGEAVLSYGSSQYFSWGGYAIQRLTGSAGNYDLISVGPDQGEGLPDERRGRCVRLTGTPAGIMAAIRSEGVSSVLVLPGDAPGWHEVWRGWAAGEKIDDIYFQDSYRPRLWISIGGEIVYQDWPRQTLNPLRDGGITYAPEAQLVSSTIDMGASRLPKLIKEVSAAVENLSSDAEVHLDYQINADVDTGNWIYAGVFQVNPFDTLPVNQGEVTRIRFRLRLVTRVESIPPVVNATVLEGFARTPVKYRWRVKLKISSTQRDLSGIAKDVDPDEFITWLKEAAVSSRRIFMRAIWAQMDGKYVVVEPPTLLRTFVNNLLGFWGGSVELSLREI